MSNPTPTLRDTIANMIYRDAAAYRSSYETADRILALLPLDPGEAPAPAGVDLEPLWAAMQPDATSEERAAGKALWRQLDKMKGTPSPQGLGEARTPREVPREVWMCFHLGNPTPYISTGAADSLASLREGYEWVRMVEAPAPAPKGEA